MRRLDHPYLLLSLCSLFWAGNTVVGRAAVNLVPPATMTFVRWAIAFVVLLPFAWAHVVRDWPAIRSHLVAITLLALIGSAGYNLIGVKNPGCTFRADTGDKVGTVALPLDPMLGPLADNGGSTFTHALKGGSPAIDAGNPSVCGTMPDARTRRLTLRVILNPLRTSSAVTIRSPVSRSSSTLATLPLISSIFGSALTLNRNSSSRPGTRTSI